jgi:DNA replication protein DnaC
MRNTWRPVCNVRSLPATPTAAKTASGPRGSRRKSIEEFDFDHARGLKRDLIAHLATLDFVAAKENVIFLGPPGTGMHCAFLSQG